jgi:hypothetical protein
LNVGFREGIAVGIDTNCIIQSAESKKLGQTSLANEIELSSELASLFIKSSHIASDTKISLLAVIKSLFSSGKAISFCPFFITSIATTL